MNEGGAERSSSGLSELFTQAGRPLLMPYLTAGFPDLSGSRRLMRLYQEAGADIIELGVPFSDPLADGPVIQASSSQALAGGVRQRDVFGLAAQAVSEGSAVVLLAYLNTILAPGSPAFFRHCADAGILGVVVPDLPVEEAAGLQTTARQVGVDLVLLAAPTSPEDRLARIAGQASGFIYCVSGTGVTGARTSLSSDLPAFLARLRRHTALPLAVGFGISTPEQAGEVARVADGVIIGSKLVAMVQEAGGVGPAEARIAQFLEQVRARMAAASATPGPTL